jgi:hypothetical protein
MGSIGRVGDVRVGTSGRAAGDAGASRFTRLGILVTIVVVVAGSAAQLIDYAFFGQRIRALDSASAGGVFGAVGDIAVAGAAVSAWVLAARVRSARWVAALAGLLTFLAADQVTDLHEHISHWIAIYLSVLASFIGLAAVAQGLSGRLRFGVDSGIGHTVTDRLIGIGLGLLAFSFLLHVFGQRLLVELGVNSASLGYQIKVVVKHGTEVAGWLLIALGMLRTGLPGIRHNDTGQTK